jgi:hypothetical protein
MTSEGAGSGRLSVVATADEVEQLVARSRGLPPADSVPAVILEHDFILNVLTTVLDIQMSTTTVVRALEHFRAKHGDRIRTMGDLQPVLGRFSDDRQGNTALAQYLWGYNLWTRAHMLRDLVGYFDGIEVRDQESLRAWAAHSEFQADFQGKVKGLGLASYKSLLIRQGVDTVKPDTHVTRFVEAAIGRRPPAAEVITLVEDAARRLKLPAAELDWRIWEHQRQQSGAAVTRFRPGR